MITPKARRAIVVGNTLDGLLALSALRAIGWDASLFDGDCVAPTIGLVLQDDVVKAMRFGGINLRQVFGVASSERVYLDSDDIVMQRVFKPQTLSAADVLRSALMGGGAAEAMHLGDAVVATGSHGDSAQVHLASGRVETADLVIVADGAGSTLRSHLLPDVSPTYAGYVAWRGLVPENELPEPSRFRLGSSFAMQHGFGHLFVQYMVPGEDGSVGKGRRRWNWVWYRLRGEGDELASTLTDHEGHRHALTLPPGAMRFVEGASLRSASRAMLAPAFQDAVHATAQPFVHAIVDLRVPRMVFGRVVLLGDTAFMARPHTSNRTSKAAVNAMALAKSIRQHGPEVDAALNAWQDEQLPIGLRAVETSMSMGDRIMGIGGRQAEHSLPDMAGAARRSRLA